jgi:hypothetical protein
MKKKTSVIKIQQRLHDLFIRWSKPYIATGSRPLCVYMDLYNNDYVIRVDLHNMNINYYLNPIYDHVELSYSVMEYLEYALSEEEKNFTKQVQFYCYSIGETYNEIYKLYTLELK